MSAQRPQQPWSMAWVIVAIICTIVPYTFLRWHFRKPGPVYEPYHEMKDRANTLRLLSAGFQRIPLEADRPADPLRSAATAAAVFPAPTGVPQALAASLVDSPVLPTEVIAVSTAAAGHAQSPYSIGVTCTMPDIKQQLGGAYLYVRDEEAVVIPTFESLDDHLLARAREIYVRFTVPPGALKPGRYHVTIPGSRTSKAWTLDIK
jgi:hypothetical protein